VVKTAGRIAHPYINDCAATAQENNEQIRVPATGARHIRNCRASAAAQGGWCELLVDKGVKGLLPPPTGTSAPTRCCMTAPPAGLETDGVFRSLACKRTANSIP